ncbi:MAG: hypothetical protein Kow00107_11820 [Planctomycetota bacterium]
MTESEWMETVLSIANIVLDLHGEEIRANRSKPWFDEYILDRAEAYLRHSPSMRGDLYSFIRYSAKQDHDPSLWADEDNWNSVLYNVSFACLSHDVAVYVRKILEGKAPRRTSPLNFPKEESQNAHEDQ